MGFRDEFQGTGKTYAQWSMERTAQVGIRSNEEKLRSLQGAMKSTFEKGISRIVETQESSAAALQGELAYQSERIVGAIEQSSSNVADAIQQMADYLGAGLEEIRCSAEFIPPSCLFSVAIKLASGAKIPFSAAC